MKPPAANGRPDDFQTPKEALIPLLKYLKRDWRIWECAEGQGNLSNALWEAGFNVVGSDILKGDFPSILSVNRNTKKTYTRIWERSFLDWTPDGWDCIITNPPFSLKGEFLEKAYKSGRPFAFLLPLTTFEGKKRQKLFKKYGLEVILFDKRINFTTPSGRGSGSWFATAWFTWGLNLGKELNFVNFVAAGNHTLTEYMEAVL